MKTPTLALTAALSALALAGGEPATRRPRDVAAARERIRNRTGGFILDRRAARGAIHFVNAQTRAPSDALARAAEALEGDSWLTCRTVDAPGLAFGAIAARMASEGWSAAVVALEDDGLPVMLVQPEGRWAAVNVAALAADSPTAQRLAERVAKEALRAAAFLFGCGYSMQGGGLADALRTPAELDLCLQARLPVDVFTTMQSFAGKFGMVPCKRTFYSRAVEEGWAPPPANAYQSNAWHRVKAAADTNALPAAARWERDFQRRDGR